MLATFNAAAPIALVIFLSWIVGLDGLSRTIAIIAGVTLPIFIYVAQNL